MNARKFIPWLLIGVGLLVYRNSFHNEFIFDDLPYIVDNARVRQLWPLGQIISHTSRPVVLLSVALNYVFGGLNPWGYHLFNLGIHILAALILYEVARLTFLSETLRVRFGEAAPWLAGVISLIWLVHPLQTESVTYTIQRGESLMGLFYLLTLYCVIRSRKTSRSSWWQVGAVVSCALGMASKPVMVTAPVVLLLYDRAFLARSWRELLGQRWMLYAGLAATWLLLPLLLANAPSEWTESAGFDYRYVPPLPYLFTQPGVIFHYLRLTFWPQPLCFDYGWEYGWPPVRTAGEALPTLTVVGALLAGTAWAWRRAPALGFLGVWFFLILAPTSSFVPLADLVVEHRMYLPLAAVIALVTVGGFELGRNLLSTRPRTRRTLGCAVSLALVVPLAVLTIQRNRDYTSALTIWQDTVVKRPNNPRAHNALGLALAQAGRVQDGIDQYEQALRIKPDYGQAHNNLGLALCQKGRFEEAIAHLEQAVRIYPGYAKAHNNLGIALAQTGRIQEAVGQFGQALQIKPDLAEAHNNLGHALFLLGQVPEAIEHCEQALRIKPDYAEAHYYLGVALEQVGRVPEAIGHYDEALRIRPDYAEARRRLAPLRAGLARPRTVQ